jgi:hypothetical protein
MVWFATGVVLTLLATVLVMQTWRVDAVPGDTDSTFVPTSPCRLFDYRPAPHTVGPRSAPLGAGDTHIQQVTGSNGDCIGPLAIPGDAVAVAMNVTAVGPTAQSNLRVFPADVATVPTVSNLNFSAGQKPVPNKVDVRLSPDGKIKLFNAAGSVSVVGDVVGYYTKTSLVEMASRLAAAEGKIAALDETQPFSVTKEDRGATGLDNTPTAYVSVSVSAPVAGHVTLNSTARLHHSTNGGDMVCAIYETGSIPGSIGPDTPSVQYFEALDLGNDGSLSGTRRFSIADGTTVSYSLACEEGQDGAVIEERNLTAIFTPTP